MWPVSRPVWLQLFASLLVGWTISILQLPRQVQVQRKGTEGGSGPQSDMLPQWIKKQTNKNFVRLTACLHEWMSDWVCVCVCVQVSGWMTDCLGCWCKWLNELSVGCINQLGVYLKANKSTVKTDSECNCECEWVSVWLCVRHLDYAHTHTCTYIHILLLRPPLAMTCAI